MEIYKLHSCIILSEWFIHLLNMWLLIHASNIVKSFALTVAGLDEKLIVEAADVDKNLNITRDSAEPECNAYIEGLSLNLQELDYSRNLEFQILKLLQSDVPDLVDSASVGSTIISKLLVLKRNYSKALLMTESEIDLLENELKSLKHVSVVDIPSTERDAELGSTEHHTPVSVAVPSIRLQVVSSGEIVDKLSFSNIHSGETHVDADSKDIDGPGVSTSLFVESSSSDKDRFLPEYLKHSGSCENPHTMPSKYIEARGSMTCSLGGDTRVYAPKEDMLENNRVTDVPVFDDANRVGDLSEEILASNRESAAEAFSGFYKLLPKKLSKSSFSCLPNCSLVRDKFLRKKRLQRVKERVIALKLKAFQNLQKKDLCLVSLTRPLSESQKKFATSRCSVQRGYHRCGDSSHAQLSPGINLCSSFLYFCSKLSFLFYCEV